jgi:hypothetical protein
MLKGIHLSLLVGPVAVAPAPREVVDALVSAQVTVAAGQRSGFQLVFTCGKESALNRELLPTGYLSPGTRVILVATINSLPHVLMDGLVTRQDFAPSNQPGQARVTITGEDVSVAMDLIDFSGFPYPAMPPEARIAVCILKYAMFGLIPAIIPSIFPDVSIPTNEIPTHQGTDLAYIKKLADDAGYVFYIEPGPAPGANLAYWGPEIRVGVPQPALNVDFDAHTNVESLSFSQEGLTREQPYIMVHEPTTRLNLPIPLPNVSLLKPPLAARPALALKFTKLDTAHLSPLRAALLGVSKASSSDAVTGSGSLNVLRYGRPLKARQLVVVRGAGPACDGLYYVKSVTHTIKAGEYKQSFSLAREGLVSLVPQVPV